MMEIVAIALALVLAVFCVWLAVRIVNRKERWAKWLAVGLAIALLVYPLSFGPVTWLMNHDYVPEWMAWPVEIFYWPLAVTSAYGLEPLRKVLFWYTTLWV